MSSNTPGAGQLSQKPPVLEYETPAHMCDPFAPRIPTGPFTKFIWRFARRAGRAMKPLLKPSRRLYTPPDRR